MHTLAVCRATKARTLASIFLTATALLATVAPATALDPPEWSPAEVVYRDPMAASYGTRALFDDQGDLFLLWQAGNRGEAFVSRYVGGFGWESPAKVASGPELDLWSFAFDVNGRGQAIVAWSGGLPQGVQVSRYEPGAGWRTVEPADRSEGPNGPGAVAGVLSEDGTAYLAWSWSRMTGNVGGIPQFAYDIRTAASLGESWVSGGRLNEGDVPQGVNPSVALSARGGAVVVWSEFVEENNSAVFASPLLAAGGFGEPVRLSGAETNRTDQPYAGADADGNFFAVWRASRDLGTDIVAVRGNASAWGDPQVVGFAASKWGYWGEPSLAISRSGAALLVWTEDALSGMTARYATFLPGRGWSAPLGFGAEGHANNRPRALVDGGENFSVVWQQTFDLPDYTFEIWWAPFNVSSLFGTAVQLYRGIFGAGPVAGVDVHGNGVVLWSVWNDNGREGQLFARHQTVVALQGIRSPFGGGLVTIAIALAAVATATISILVFRRRLKRNSVAKKEKAAEPAKKP